MTTIHNWTFAFLLAANLAPQSFAQAPSFDWAVGAGGPGFDRADAVATDASGNVLVTGSYQGPADFGATNFTENGAFLAKYDSSGNILWVLNTAVGLSGTGLNVVLDRTGNIYMAGRFSRTARFGDVTLTANGISLFIVKYERNGKQLWVTTSSGGSTWVYSGAVDRNGNIAITGNVSGVATFGQFTLNGNTQHGTIFVAKYDSDGKCLWARQEDAGGSGLNSGYGVAVDPADNILVTGQFGGTITFGSQSYTSQGSEDTFVAKYSPAGDIISARTGGGVGGKNAIAVDQAGNAYLTGSSDAFVAKYDPSGNVLWVVQASGNPETIAVDAFGNSFIAGYLYGTAVFGGTTLTSSGASDVFVAKLDSSGNFLWAKQGQGGFGEADALALDGVGNLYLCGLFSNLAQFDQITLSNNDSTGTSDRPGTSDMFLARIAAPVMPSLSVHRKDNRVVLSWPAAATGFSVQSAFNLSVPNWTTLANSPTLIADQYVLEGDLGTSTQFFRLIKP